MADYDRVRRDEERAREMEADTADTYDETEGHASTGGAMAAGAVTGGAIGMVAGPIGAAVGAVGGAIVGAITERVMHGQEGHDHLEGDEDHYEGDHVHTGEDDGHDHRFHYTAPAASAGYMASETTTRTVDTDYDTTRRMDADYDATRREGDTLRLREEELAVDRERVQAGEVRVGKEVVAEERTIDVPVTREEVFIERRPIDRRPATDADLTEGETIRVPVMEEEINVEKRAVVTEEVNVGKRAVQETERVTETLRREEPVIERSGDVMVSGAGSMGSSSFSSWDEMMPRFRTSFQQRYGSSGQSWAEYEPRYRFGYDMYNDPRFRGRSFDEIEPDLRSDWEARHYGSAWDEVKMTIREAWDSLTGSTTRRA